MTACTVKLNVPQKSMQVNRGQQRLYVEEYCIEARGLRIQMRNLLAQVKLYVYN